MVVLFLLLTILPDAVAQDDPTRFLRWAYQDSGALLKEVGPRLPLYGLGSRVLLVPASKFDQQVLNSVQNGYEGVWGHYLDITNELGGPLAVIPLIGIFEASMLTRDTRFQDASFTSLQSWIYAGLISGIYKVVFGRYRPDSGRTPTDYDFLSGNTSFPSGHATAAFAIITPWVLYYPHPTTYALFALSTGTAIARIAQNKHWPSDVLAGAAIGIFTARWLTKRHQGTGATPRRSVSLTPVVGSGALGLQVNARLR